MPRFAIPLGALVLMLGAVPAPAPAQPPAQPQKTDVQQQNEQSPGCQHMLPDATPQHCVYHARNIGAPRNMIRSSADELLLSPRHLRPTSGPHRFG